MDRLRARVEPAGLAPADALALVVLLAGAVALTAAVWWTNRPVETAAPQPVSSASPLPGRPLDHVSPEPRTAAAGPESAAPPPGTPSELVVHVAGQVTRPGLVTLQPGARVADALQAAGGPTAEAVTDALNLARPVADGEQILVPALGEELPPPPSGSADPAADGPLDLNAATADDLQQLPGVGPVTAERIIQHRTDIGGFVDVTQLLEVPGIGPSRFADLEPRVRV